MLCAAAACLAHSLLGFSSKMHCLPARIMHSFQAPSCRGYLDDSTSSSMLTLSRNAPCQHACAVVDCTTKQISLACRQFSNVVVLLFKLFAIAVCCCRRTYLEEVLLLAGLPAWKAAMQHRYAEWLLAQDSMLSASDAQVCLLLPLHKWAVRVQVGLLRPNDTVQLIIKCSRLICLSCGHETLLASFGLQDAQQAA